VYGYNRGLNIGAISGIASTFLERRYGFWAAFLLPLSGLWIAPAVLVAGRKKFSKDFCVMSVQNISDELIRDSISTSKRKRVAQEEKSAVRVNKATNTA
jgi:uncharacterized protein YejL (UPF0352 family)